MFHSTFWAEIISFCVTKPLYKGLNNLYLIFDAQNDGHSFFLLQIFFPSATIIARFINTFTMLWSGLMMGHKFVQ